MKIKIALWLIGDRTVLKGMTFIGPLFIDHDLNAVVADCKFYAKEPSTVMDPESKFSSVRAGTNVIPFPNGN